MFPVMRNSRTAHGAARCPLGVVLVLFLLSAAVPAAAMDTPLEGIPLPRAVTKMEQQLGVSDNELPGGKKSGAGNAGALLSSYDQSILAGGPPQTGDGPAPGSPPPPPPASAPAPSYQYAQPAYAGAPTYSYGQSAYAQPAYSYPQSQAYGTASAAQGYTGYQQSATSPFQYPQPQYGYPAYAAQGQYGYPQYQPAVQPQQPAQAQTWPAAGGANYYDYSQASGKLAGANGDIASAAAFTEKPANQYSNLGWHPTLERMMGVHKAARNKGPRLALKGMLNGMKTLQKPHMSISPSVDPHQVSVAAQKLELAQALLRKSVAKGLILRESAPDIKIALGKNEDPCSTLACERARTDGGRHAMSQNAEQTLKASLAKHPVGGPDAKNPLFHDPAPKAPLPPHPPPSHLTPKQTAHQTFEQRFKELAGKGDSSPPTPHPPLGSPHGRGGGGRRESGEAQERARRRLQRMHAASPGHGRSGGSGPHGGERDTGGSEQRVAAAHEHLAAKRHKARHGQGLAALAHQRHHAFHFPAYMVKNSADEQGGVLMGPNGEPRMKKIGPESSAAMGILIVIFVGLLGLAGLLGWMHARKERKRNEMVALSGFADD